MSTATWSAPLPPPEILARYSDCVPDGANRIMKLWESETAHRHNMEIADARARDKDINTMRIDVVLSRIITLIFITGAIGASLYACLNGSPIFGTILGSGTLAAVVVALRHNFKSKS